MENIAESAERQLRVDLAAAFRLAAHFDWHESVANHFSAALSPDGRRFLLNPKWAHFSRLRASDMLSLDADGQNVLQRPDAPDVTAFAIHGRIHRAVPQARCIMHLHPPYATALAALADCEVKPVDQNCARFFKRVAYDRDYGGFADSDAEGDRLAAVLGGKKVMLMANHGVLTVGASVAEAFDLMYYFERACRTLILAYSTGQPLRLLPAAVAEATARDWEAYHGWPEAHFTEQKALLAGDYAS